MSKEKYEPSNGTEFTLFTSEWCDQCEADRTWREKMTGGCEILTRVVVYSRNDPEYPEEWTFDENGKPCCTAYCTEPSEHPPHAMKMREDKGQLTLFWKGKD